MITIVIDTVQCNKNQLTSKIEEYHNLGYFVNVKASNIKEGDYFNNPDCTYVLDILKQKEETN